MKIITTFDEAKDHLDNNGVLLYPTETVWGLGSLYTSKEAYNEIFEIKKRDNGKPVILIIPSIEFVKNVVTENNYKDKILFFINSIWPNDVTFVFDVKEEKIPSFILAQDKSVAMRLPSHKKLSEFLKFINIPITSTSANETGFEAIKSKESAIDFFSKIKNNALAVLDLGECGKTKPSTIIDLRYESLVNNKNLILREGDNIDFYKTKLNEFLNELHNR